MKPDMTRRGPFWTCLFEAAKDLRRLHNAEVPLASNLLHHASEVDDHFRLLEAHCSAAQRLFRLASMHIDEFVAWHHKHAGGCSVEMEDLAERLKKAIEQMNAQVLIPRQGVWSPLDKNDTFSDLMDVKEFKEACAMGAFIDYDGYGHAVKDGMIDHTFDVRPSRIWEIPADATHVDWYNR